MKNLSAEKYFKPPRKFFPQVSFVRGGREKFICRKIFQTAEKIFPQVSGGGS
ncbi:MAG: hypothetical protein IJR52_01620 [Selenomonadaceae bacterium]|nr:hypothetical protein [Selenomonadaceae bacterium]